MKKKADVNMEEVIYNLGDTIAKKLGKASSELMDVVDNLNDEEGKAFSSYLANKGIDLDKKIVDLYYSVVELQTRVQEISMEDVAIKKSRLRRVADSSADSLRSDRAKLDQGGWMLIDAPPYATSDNSYTGYVNQNPDNVYYKRLIEKSETKPSQYTSEDFVNDYFEDDQFTLKQTK